MIICDSLLTTIQHVNNFLGAACDDVTLVDDDLNKVKQLTTEVTANWTMCTSNMNFF